MLGSVVFPDVELAACGQTRDLLAARMEPYAFDVYVGVRYPTAPPPRAVVFRRAGGGRRDDVSEVARLTVSVWADTDQEAMDLARLVRALAHALWGGPIAHVTDSAGPSPIDDSSGRARVYFALNVTVQGVDLT